MSFDYYNTNSGRPLGFLVVGLTAAYIEVGTVLEEKAVGLLSRDPPPPLPRPIMPLQHIQF